jgi:hypothetical protein
VLTQINSKLAAFWKSKAALMNPVPSSDAPLEDSNRWGPASEGDLPEFSAQLVRLKLSLENAGSPEGEAGQPEAKLVPVKVPRAVSRSGDQTLP